MHKEQSSIVDYKRQMKSRGPEENDHLKGTECNMIRAKPSQRYCFGPFVV